MTTTTTMPTKRAMPATTATAKPAAKPAQANRGATLLKTTLVAGGIIATLLGANLAARQDQLTTTAVTATYTTNPQAIAALPNLSAIDQETTDTNAVLNMPLAPIPSITLPSVTTSQSSR